jgi:hypothetical protein
MRRRLLILVSTLSISILAAPAIAAQHLWGASYLDWSGALLSKDSSVSQVIQPLELSGYMFWEAGWNWDNAPDGGYGGVQTSGITATGKVSDIAIFSIWNGIEAMPGRDAGCLPFDGEGVGYSCRLPIKLNAGSKYKITFSQAKSRGSDWWMAQITQPKRAPQVIGYIRANTKNLRSSNWNNFIEYWGEQVACEAVGRASARFYRPTSSKKSVRFSKPVFSRPQEACVKSSLDRTNSNNPASVTMRFGGM